MVISGRRTLAYKKMAGWGTRHFGGGLDGGGLGLKVSNFEPEILRRREEPPANRFLYTVVTDSPVGRARAIKTS